MARGWESKSVEEQMSEAEAAGNDAGQRPQLSAEQVKARRQRETLLLARARVRQDLTAAQNPRHKELLEQTLAALDAQIADLK